MTIPEAVQLVIQAGAIGGRGQVYVLDMGEPVKIVDLADTMIRLSGKEPGRDIAIEFVGARPGEKLHEELWSKDETVTPSSHEAILLVTRPPIDAAWLEEELDALERLVAGGRDARARRTPEHARRRAAPRASSPETERAPLRRRPPPRPSSWPTSATSPGLRSCTISRSCPLSRFWNRLARRCHRAGSSMSQRVRLHVDEERAGAEHRRDVDDAARLPRCPAGCVRSGRCQSPSSDRLVRPRRRPARSPVENGIAARRRVLPVRGRSAGP